MEGLQTVGFKVLWQISHIGGSNSQDWITTTSSSLYKKITAYEWTGDTGFCVLVSICQLSVVGLVLTNHGWVAFGCM